MQTQPFSNLKERFEQLDIKLLTDYNTKYTTHVVSKKRNTSKGLQALINGKYIVTETFLDAVVAATDLSEGDGPSALEEDFLGGWPSEMEHLPPRGGEPVQHPNDIYKPDVGRGEIFDGYTFIFYDPAQFNNLLAPIANACGKALLKEVAPNETVVDDFIRYVKSVAGEKGLGSFEDGSEGRGVVLVRYVPSKGDHVTWYANFFTEVSLRLDHRPIEQSEFLEAILIKDAAILRRALEVESAPKSQQNPPRGPAPQRHAALRSAANGTSSPETEQTEPEVVEEVSTEAPAPAPAPRRARPPRAIKRRFAGFDDGSDVEMNSVPTPPPSRPLVQLDPRDLEDESGLFVSQQVEQSQDPQDVERSQNQRKRSAAPEDDLMDGMAPSAARFKKQRIARGDNFAEPTPEPEVEAEAAVAAPKTKKIKKELDVLAVVAQNREQEEARARAEKEDLAQLPEGIDLAEIRKLNIVEEMEIRKPAEAGRTRERDIADGRWNPAWNGMKNFKKFRKRGENQGRQVPRTIISLTEVKTKEFGVGDDYWLEDEDSQRKKKTQSQPNLLDTQDTPPEPPKAAPPTRKSRVVQSDSDDDEEDEELESVSELAANAGRSRAGAKATSQSSSRQTSQSQKKRQAPEPTKEQPAKRQRPLRKALEIPDSEGSDDELKFKFGKRR